ncbi:MAG: hypothetical protein EXS05_23670 [Planctomycetaceae bacterium]|nr:hypothetical protein [Planctomycetaceae bacterium]
MRNSDAVLRQLLIPLVSVAGALGLLAVVVYWVRVWWRDSDGPAASGCELLSEYRELNRRGELSDEEYRIIKSRFAPKPLAMNGPAKGKELPRPVKPAEATPNAEPAQTEPAQAEPGSLQKS